jgi:hypothetical protein
LRERENTLYADSALSERQKREKEREDFASLLDPLEKEVVVIDLENVLLLPSSLHACSLLYLNYVLD